MSTLHVIRHGKASPEGKVYDQLHALGERQARLLGEHFGARAMRFDALYVGPLVRQRETLRLMREAAGAAARDWPAEIIVDELAEAPVEHLIKHCLAHVMPSDPALQAIVQAAGDGKDMTKIRTMVEQILAHTLHLWTDEKIELPGVESAHAFSTRVERAFERIAQAAGRGRHIAVVTSNGVIGYLLAKLAGQPEALRSGFVSRIYNSSVTRIEVSDAGLRVLGENAIEHLLDAELHTLL